MKLTYASTSWWQAKRHSWVIRPSDRGWSVRNHREFDVSTYKIEVNNKIVSNSLVRMAIFDAGPYQQTLLVDGNESLSWCVSRSLEGLVCGLVLVTWLELQCIQRFEIQGFARRDAWFFVIRTDQFSKFPCLRDDDLVLTIWQ